MITLNDLTKDYGKGRGVFDLNLDIKKGEVFGLVGKNGAGKTTTMRLLMGFLKPDRGTAIIDELDTWKDASKVKKLVGYVPGEIAFPDAKYGTSFLKMQLELLKNNQNDYVNELIQLFKIDTTADLKRMSKGMKQKMALVCAFMTKPPVLLLDEPTTGLDPVMRDAFINLIKKVKANGTTIIMSSHMFNELEPTCDRIGFLKDGKLIDILDQKKIKQIHSQQLLTVNTFGQEDYKKLKQSSFGMINSDDQQLKVSFLVDEKQMPNVIQMLGKINLKDVSFEEQSLNKYFEKELKQV